MIHLQERDIKTILESEDTRLLLAFSRDVIGHYSLFHHHRKQIAFAIDNLLGEHGTIRSLLEPTLAPPDGAEGTPQ